MAALMKVAEESQAPPLTMCAPVGASFAVRRASKMRGAVGDAIGLGRGDWLAGEVNPLTDGTNPMQVVLDSYYEKVAEFPPPFSKSGINVFETSSAIRDNDVVCLVGSRGPDYPHAMRVRGRKGRHWVVGKFGEDSVLWTPIATVARAYEGQFDRVWVLRLKTGVRGERP